MKALEIKNLVKIYHSYEKERGFAASLQSLFVRKYKEVRAVNDVSFSLAEGELIGLLGPNGAGKTTILKCLSGIALPTSGVLSVLGFSPANHDNAYKMNIGLVTGQKNQLFWDLPPIETFYFNKEIYEIESKQFDKRLNELSSLLEVQSVMKTPTRTLSLGERMKCELIAALLHSPRVLFLDEPTIGLDVVAQKNIRDFIKNYNEETSATVILTSHSMEDVKRLCKRVIVIGKGKLIFDGDLSELTQKHIETKRVSLVLGEQVEKAKLEALGDLRRYSFPLAIFFVERTAIFPFVEKIIKELPIVDLNIEEPSVDLALRTLFKQVDEGGSA